MNDGEVLSVGDAEVPFSVQSISKVFSLSLVVADDGDRIWGRVGREPSGNPFNSLLQLDQEHGRPRNPFINAGALVVTDRLQALTGDASGALRDLLRAETGNPEVDADPRSPGPRPSTATATPPWRTCWPATATSSARSTTCWSSTCGSARWR